MRNQSIGSAICILSPCVILHALGMDIFVPCVPMMQEALQSSFSKVQWALSIFVIATGVGQLFVGPLADKYGRRVVMLVSIWLFLIASYACAAANGINFLIFARFLQGLGSCGTMVATWAIVRDVFDDNNRPKMYSYLNAALGLAPLLAPLLGGYLYTWFDTWRATFYFLVAFSVVTLGIAYLYLDETRPKLTVTQGYNYLSVIQVVPFWCYVTCAITALTSLFTFFSISPILLIERLGVLPIDYGYFFGLNGLVYIVFSIFAPRMKKRLGLPKTIFLGSILIFLGASSMLIWHLVDGLSKAGLMVPNLIMTAGVGLSFGACTAGALAPFKDIAGTAAAAYGFLLYSGAGLIGALAMQFEVSSTTNLAITMMAMGFANFVALAVLKATNKSTK